MHSICATSRATGIAARLARRSLALSVCVLGAAAVPLRALRAQTAAQAPLPQPSDVRRLELIAGRSFPISGGAPIAKVTVANPAVADVVVIGETEVVINGITAGETDIILWGNNTPRRHYRVIVRSSPERRQVLLSVKFAEVRKDALRQIGTSLLFKPSPGSTRVGTGTFNGDGTIKTLQAFDVAGNPIGQPVNVPDPNVPSAGTNGKALLPSALNFLSVLTTFNSRELLGLLAAEEQLGNARSLAEPNLMAANRDTASFLAGGEIPVPVVQGGAGGGQSAVTIQYRKFGVQLQFVAEVLSDSLIKLKVMPEVSTLDYGNAVTISGFRVPALRTRRVETTVDVLGDRSLIISGLFNEEQENVRTGIPFLSKLPILGNLFSSQRWLKSESELIVVVTPVIMDPNNPRAADLLRFNTESAVPAGKALEKRFPGKPPT